MLHICTEGIVGRSYRQLIDGRFGDLQSGERLARGLSGGIWMNRHDEALATARGIRAGAVWVNSWMDGYAEIPFGGVRESGLGREQGAQVIDEFTERKFVPFDQGSRRHLWTPGAGG